MYIELTSVAYTQQLGIPQLVIALQDVLFVGLKSSIFALTGRQLMFAHHVD